MPSTAWAALNQGKNFTAYSRNKTKTNQKLFKQSFLPNQPNPSDDSPL
jgi:hypothetical protein